MKTKLKQLQCTWYCDDDLGEMNAVFDGEKLVSSWSCNDATMREEYFAELFAYMGYEMINKELSKTQTATLRDYWL